MTSQFPQVPSLRARSRSRWRPDLQLVGRAAGRRLLAVCGADDPHDVGTPSALGEEGGHRPRQQPGALEPAEQLEVVVPPVQRHRDRPGPERTLLAERRVIDQLPGGPAGSDPGESGHVHRLDRQPGRRRGHRGEIDPGRSQGRPGQRPVGEALAHAGDVGHDGLPATRTRCPRGRGEAPRAPPRRRPWRPASVPPTSSAARSSGPGSGPRCAPRRASRS